MSAPGARRRDLAGGGVGLVVALAVLFGALAMPMGTSGNPGAGFLPFWAGVVLAAMSLVLIARGVLVTPREHDGDAGDARPVAVIVIGLLGYALTLERLGYLLATFLLLGGLSRILGGRGWPIVLGFAATATAASWALFGLWLGVPLPSGVFGR